MNGSTTNENQTERNQTKYERVLLPSDLLWSVLVLSGLVGLHGRTFRLNRLQVTEELALSLAEMSFASAFWLLFFVPHTEKWPPNVERKVGEGGSGGEAGGGGGVGRGVPAD